MQNKHGRTQAFSIRLVIFLMVGTLFSWCTFIYAQAPDTLWTKTYGGSGLDGANSVQQTTDGGYIIVGESNSYGTGWMDVYLIKTDNKGDTLWTKTYGGDYGDLGYSVQQTTDGGYIVTGATLDMFTEFDTYIIKTDENGDTLWTKVYRSDYNDLGECIQQTIDGGYIIAGTICHCPEPTDSYDIYLLKTDENGDTLWTRAYGGAYMEFGYSVQQTTDGGYIIVGETQNSTYGETNVYLIKTDDSGDTLWTKTYGVDEADESGQSVQQTADGGYIIAALAIYSNGHYIYLVKTDENGDSLWTRVYGGGGGYSVQQTTDGGYIVAGGYLSVCLVKTDENGDILWFNFYGGSGEESGFSVDQTTDGGYIVAGYTNSFGAGENDVYVIKTGPEGGINDVSATNISEGRLLRNSPNPFVKKTSIQYSIPGTSDISIKIYDVTGVLVKTLVDARVESGVHMVSWDGKDMFDRKLGSGVYFCQLEAEKSVTTKKIILAR